MKDLQPYLFDSDAASITTFVREMVSQSIIPFMEGRVATWNHQIASRWKGFGGRVMSLSKRWVGLGAVSRTKPSPSHDIASFGSNLDASQGHYMTESLEASMHRLADYAFMLRDWKLSTNIYNILQAEFCDAKAWSHLANVQEMTALSLLLTTQTTGAVLKNDVVDEMLDAASYSYLTRCADSSGAIRCLVLATELLRRIEKFEGEAVAKWADRALSLSIMSPLAQSILCERLAVSYISRTQVGKLSYGLRNRKAAFWNLLSSDVWLLLGKPKCAQIRLEQAKLVHLEHVSKGFVIS